MNIRLSIGLLLPAIFLAVSVKGSTTPETLAAPREIMGNLWPAGTEVNLNEKGELARCRLAQEFSTSSGFKLPAGTEIWSFTAGQPCACCLHGDSHFCGLTLPQHSTVFLPSVRAGWRLWPSQPVLIQGHLCGASDDGVGHFFYFDGALRAAWLVGIQEIEDVPCVSAVAGMPMQVWVYGTDRMAWFYRNGHLRQAMVAREVEIQGRIFTKGDIIVFNRDGTLDRTGLTLGWDSRGPVKLNFLGVIEPGDRIPEAAGDAAKTEAAKLAAVTSALVVRRAARLANSAMPPEVPPSGLIAVQGFKNAGQSTPTAAVETIIWASHHGETKRLAELITWGAGGIEAARDFIGKLTPETRGLAGSPESLVATLMAYRYPVGRSCRIPPGAAGRGPSDWFLLCETSLADGDRDCVTYRLRLEGQRWMLVVNRHNVIDLGRILTQDGVLPPPTED